MTVFIRGCWTYLEPPSRQLKFYCGDETNLRVQWSWLRGVLDRFRDLALEEIGVFVSDQLPPMKKEG
jgi:hypothetical protein